MGKDKALVRTHLDGAGNHLRLSEPRGRYDERPLRLSQKLSVSFRMHNSVNA